MRRGFIVLVAAFVLNLVILAWALCLVWRIGFSGWLA